MARNITVCAAVSPEQYTAMQKEAEKRNITISSLTREALSAFLGYKEEELLRKKASFRKKVAAE